MEDYIGRRKLNKSVPIADCRLRSQSLNVEEFLVARIKHVLRLCRDKLHLGCCPGELRRAVCGQCRCLYNKWV